MNAGEYDSEDGVEAAFEIVTDINENVRTGQWVGDCFIYTNSANRLNYLVGDQTYTVSHFDQSMYLLGYIPRDGRAYVADKDVNVTSYALSLSVVEYQTLILRGDMDTAAELLEDIPADQKNKVARFLEGQGYKEMALEVATDPEHRFDLALSLNNLPIALEIAREADVTPLENRRRRRPANLGPRPRRRMFQQRQRPRLPAFTLYLDREYSWFAQIDGTG